MITITKTSSSCLSNRIVPCSTSFRQLNTYIIKIHSSRSTIPIHTFDYWQQQKQYAAN